MALGVASDGTPHVVFSNHDSVATDELVDMYYSGGSWTETQILSDNDVNYGGAHHPDGDIYIESPTTINVVFSITVGSYQELQEYRTTNTGATWAKSRDITSGSSVHNQIPAYAVDDDAHIIEDVRVLFLTDSTTDYNASRDLYVYCNNSDWTITNPVQPKYSTASTTVFQDAATEGMYVTKGASTTAPTTTTGEFGGSAMDFDGGDYLVYTPSTGWAWGTDAHTLQAYVNWDDTSGTHPTVIDCNSGAAWMMRLRSGLINFMTYNGSTFYNAEWGAPTLNQWYCLSGTYSIGSPNTLYDFGVSKATTANTTGSQNNGTGTRIGMMANGTYPINGQIDFIRIYDGALSADYLKLEGENLSDPSSFGSAGAVTESGGFSQVYIIQ